MDALVELAEKPAAREIYMIAGWRQWADAGSVSSEMPEYLIEKTGARRIGRIKPDPFYLFQFPGTHHLLRPEVKLVEGHRKELRKRKNEIYYTGDDDKGLAIFLGDEPNLDIDRYAEAFFDVVKGLGVKRVATVGGVYGAVPYDKDRTVSCLYSLRKMKKELLQYAVQFSNYEGGATIGAYLADRAEQLRIEYLVFNAFVPMYDLSQLSPSLEGLMIEEDYKAWYDLLERFNYMFNLGLDLSDLEEKSRQLSASVAGQVEELENKMPELEVREYLEKLTEDFTEMPFAPLGEVWEKGLKDILNDLEK